MRAALSACPLFEGLEPDVLGRLERLATTKRFARGEHPFVIGQAAEHMYVVLKGKVELCIPLSIQGGIEEVCVETKEPCGAVGWSAFVSPYRFRLTARVPGEAELAVFPRDDLLRLFEGDPSMGYTFMQRVARMIAERLLTVQAMWARELQRAVECDQARSAEEQPMDAAT